MTLHRQHKLPGSSRSCNWNEPSSCYNKITGEHVPSLLNWHGLIQRNVASLGGSSVGISMPRMRRSSSRLERPQLVIAPRGTTSEPLQRYSCNVIRGREVKACRYLALAPAQIRDERRESKARLWRRQAAVPSYLLNTIMLRSKGTIEI